MLKIQRRDYHALLRHDFYGFIERSFYELNPTTPFMPNWHIEVVADALERCRVGSCKRLIINQPPRSLKSLAASVAYPAFVLGHDPSAQVICASYGQDLANKLSLDCRRIIESPWYRRLFPRTRLSPQRQALQEFMTTLQGFRLATSVGGVLTGRGADWAIIDDAVKPEEAYSDTQRKGANDWFLHTLYTRLNDKKTGRIIVIMQRLHEDDLVGHILGLENWELISLPAIAEADECYAIKTPRGIRRFERRMGEALHPDREPIEVLNRIREAIGEYNFASQYQQSPAPLSGGIVKINCFKTYEDADLPTFEMKFQSWDTANKPTELSDYSACTTWGIKDKRLYLLNVFRKRLGYPELKRAVREQAEAFGADTILIEDKSSGTQLIQDLINEGVHSVKACQSSMDKIMRMYSVTSTIENGFVYVPEKASWLPEFQHELATFPMGKYDDQVDSTSQALDWYKDFSDYQALGVIDYYKQLAHDTQPETQSAAVPKSMPCSKCGGVMRQVIPNGLRCAECGAQWLRPGAVCVPTFSRRNL